MTDLAIGPSLVLRIAPHRAAAPVDVAPVDVAPVDVATVNVAVSTADPALSNRLIAAMADAVADAVAELAPWQSAELPIVRVRSRKSLTRNPDQIAGAIAIVLVADRNACRLSALIDGLRAAGAVAIQLVWDGAAPPRTAVESHVFAALEHARETPGQPPVVLAASEAPATALRLLIAHRGREAARAIAEGRRETSARGGDCQP